MSGTLSGTGKSRGVMSRTSTQTMSTALTESTNRFSYRSTSTAATSLLEDDSMLGKSPRKLTKGKLTGLALETEMENVSGDLSSVLTPSKSTDQAELSQDETRRASSFDNSERDLAMRLELAKRNGLSHRHTRSEDVSFLLRDPPFAETIYEGTRSFLSR
jgi:protein ECT2